MTDSARPPLFSVVIVSLNGEPSLPAALRSLRGLTYPRYEVIVVDNGSTDDMARVVREDFPEVRLIRSPVNLGFAGGNNLGLRAARGDILVLLNDDTEVRPEWLDAWARAASENPRWGILGAKLLYPDGRTIQHAGGFLSRNAMSWHAGYEQPDDGQFDEPIQCDYCTGAAIAIRREVFDILGPLDDAYFPIYFEETDYCWQVRRIGYEVIYVPDAVVTHHESRTQGRFSFRFLYRYNRSRLRYLSKCLAMDALGAALCEEAKWWTHRHQANFYPAMLRAYLYALPRLPAWLMRGYRFRIHMRELAHRHVGNTPA